MNKSRKNFLDETRKHIAMKMKKRKTQKKCFLTSKLKFQYYKNCLEAARIENKINHLE